MSDFRLSEQADPDKIFLTKFSEITGKRLNPSSYKMSNIFINSPFPLQPLSNFFLINPPKKENIAINGNYSFIPMKNISDKSASVIKIDSILGKDSKGYTSFSDGDFLFSKITPCMENGKMAIIKNLPTKTGFGSTEFHVFRKTTNIVTADFLRSIFLINNFRLYAKCNFTGTAGHQRVPPEFFKDLLIPIPPKNIQIEIVAKMDKAYQNKKNKEGQAQNLLDSIDTYLLDELGIDLPKQADNSLKTRIFTKKFSDIAGDRFDPFFNQPLFTQAEKNIISSNFSYTALETLVFPVSGVTYKAVDETQTGYLILRANNITLSTNELNFNKLRFINKNLTIRESSKLYENDILMSSASGSKKHVGKVAFIKKDMNCYFGAFMTVLRPKKINYSYKYVFNFLSSKIYRLMLFRFLGGTNINNVGFEKIKNFPIPLPPLEKQSQIAEHISQIRAQAKQLQIEAKIGLEQAKQEVEAMIVGNEE